MDNNGSVPSHLLTSYFTILRLPANLPSCIQSLGSCIACHSHSQIIIRPSDMAKEGGLVPDHFVSFVGQKGRGGVELDTKMSRVIKLMTSCMRERMGRNCHPTDVVTEEAAAPRMHTFPSAGTGVMCFLVWGCCAGCCLCSLAGRRGAEHVHAWIHYFYAVLGLVPVRCVALRGSERG
ncbi:hypothetical protein BT67DRAFT_67587 [Trichocladium antarcticum]|uniref:Uncharacterized protein n=1 Tax=Trichocladium antarcticum TaxID=1450529 RepID=A0AAN6UH74_9PEZI|nr:hypothetical protein BT67DRAFT_67587 [Trichocladium antarcticum]